MAYQHTAFDNYPAVVGNKQVVTDGFVFEAMVRELETRSVLTFDYETDGLRWFKGDRSCGIGFNSHDPHTGRMNNWYVPYRHLTGEKQLEWETIRPGIKRLLENPYTLKVCHNLKFEDHFTRVEGITLAGPRYCTMIAGNYFDENSFNNLEFRAERFLGRTDAREYKRLMAATVKELCKLACLKRKDYLIKYGYAQTPVNLCGIYGCHDVEFTAGLRLFYERHDVSRRYARTWGTEMQLTNDLADMEENGLLVDVPYLEGLQSSVQSVQAGLSETIYRQLGKFNPGSDAQVRHLMFERFGIPVEERTKSLLPAVNSGVLGRWVQAYPIIGEIRDWRDADKIRSTYTQSILDKLDDNNFCHTDFQQVGTNTGRLSAVSPNLQNISTDNKVRSKSWTGLALDKGGYDPWSIRRAFIVESQTKPRLFWDYSQVELRVLAHYTGDPTMTDVFMHGGDVHSRTASEIGALLLGPGQSIDRRPAKVINFGLSYCLTSMGMARQIGITEEQAENFMRAFFIKFPRIAPFREEFWAGVANSGTASFNNIFGKTRRVPGILSTEYKILNRARRQAIGALIQGTAAWLTKESIVRVSKWNRENGKPLKINNTVHDEISGDLMDPSRLVEVNAIVTSLMEDYKEFAPLPIVADGDYSITNWAEKISLPRASKEQLCQALC